VRAAMLFGNFQMFNFYVAKCLEKRCRERNEPKLNDTQCGFHPGHSTADQNFTLQQILEKSWEYAKNVYTCFVDLEKAYDWVRREKLCGGKLCPTRYAAPSLIYMNCIDSHSRVEEGVTFVSCRINRLPCKTICYC